MNLAKYKLIISDLDGTLVKYGSSSVSETVINSIFSLKKKDIFFTIGTGRSWKQTRDIARKLAVTIPVITQGGAVIIDPGTGNVMHRQPLRSELAHQLSGILQFTEVDQFCLGEDGAYFASRVNTRGGNWLVKSGEDCHLLKNNEYGQASIIKYLFIGSEPLLKHLYEKIQKEINPRPNMIMWPPTPDESDWFLEVFDPMASKGQALRWLAKHLKVKLDQIIAFGDGFNDIDMLQHAGLGVAIENAPQIVTSNARLVIPGPEQDGVARFLNDFCYKGAV